MNGSKRMKAVVLIRTIPTKERVIADKLKADFSDTTLSVYFENILATFGDYDVVGFLSGESMKSIGDFVTKHLRHMLGIDKTVTLIALDEEPMVK